MLLQLYYLYEKSLKKSREPDLKEVFDLPKSGDSPFGHREVAG